MPSPEYNQLLDEGPFPQAVDPWAEKGHYFHQIHAQMISIILQNIRKPLQSLGYVAGREATVQIIERVQPDIFIQSRTPNPERISHYSQAAAQAELEIGVALEAKHTELDRLFIYATDTGRLVTVLEVISPNNKTKYEDIHAYQQRREQILIEGVNCVEVDLSRSIKRLLDAPIAQEYPYHIAIHLHDEAARFIGMELQGRLKTFALPLRQEVMPVDLNNAYHQAYIEVSIASQIYYAGHYTEEHLPFPSLLNADERENLLAQVANWQAALKAAEA